MSTYGIVLCTCPDSGAADSLARHLVESRLAACVNQVRGVRSVYEWQGNIETSDEILLVIKTRRDLYPKLETTLRALHPYELPEIIMVPIEAGSSDYLGWISEQTSLKNKE